MKKGMLSFMRRTKAALAREAGRERVRSAHLLLCTIWVENIIT